MSETYSTLFVLLIASVSNCAWTQSPPQLNAKSKSYEQTIRPGATVTLACPVTKSKDTIYEWYKEKESVMTFGGQRLRILRNGSLKIKEAVFDDTAIYKCRAINGFGSVEFNTTLLVLGDDDDYDKYPDIYEDEDMDFDNAKITRPALLYVTKEESPIHRMPGTNFRLQCVASGYPKPEIVWFKDGLQVSRVFRAVRWGLQFTNAVPADSGNYTCIASNILGSASHSFQLLVDENKNAVRGRPSLDGKNITIEEGEKAVLECGIKSEQFPHMEWLKQVEPDLSESMKGTKGTVLQMKGEYFSVLTSPYAVDHEEEEGIYYHRLIIEIVQKEDAGKYVCLGANSYGYEYHFVFLDVIPRQRTFSSVPFPIVVTATIVAVAVLGGIFALLMYCRPQRATGSQGSTAITPMVTKEDFIPMQVSLSSGSSRGAKSNSKRSRSKQQVTYVSEAVSDMV